MILNKPKVGVPEKMSKWSGSGYDGKTFVELTKN